ncbi:hypothetical protein PIB30_026779 [Stylosanthes scabra]|uniref:Uncharacterized protein n=1 Tax=Stylosanthes scabra TaxID=79078 RepID=A0ABU6YAS7_9FABA|nr:hypothetical protein [Stylosanthes scabra]
MDLIIRVADTIVHEQGRHAVRDFIFPLANANFPVFRPVFLDTRFWQSLTQRVWHRTVLEQDTWRLEYDFWHQRHQQIAENIVQGQYNESFMEVPVLARCTCLKVSNDCFAAGFLDGHVRVYDITTMALLADLRGSIQNNPKSVCGIVISGEDRFTFAREDGDIYHGPIMGPLYRAVPGVSWPISLLSFDGNTQYWVGLYSGIPSFKVWKLVQGEPQLVFSSETSFADWRLGSPRVSVTTSGHVVACDGDSIFAFSLTDPERWTCQRWLIQTHNPIGYRMLLRTFSTYGNSCVVVVEDTQHPQHLPLRLMMIDVASGQTLGTCEVPSPYGHRLSVIGCINDRFALVHTDEHTVRVISYSRAEILLHPTTLQVNDSYLEIAAVNERYFVSYNESTFRFMVLDFLAPPE